MTGRTHIRIYSSYGSARRALYAEMDEGKAHVERAREMGLKPGVDFLVSPISEDSNGRFWLFSFRAARDAMLFKLANI